MLTLINQYAPDTIHSYYKFPMLCFTSVLDYSVTTHLWFLIPARFLPCPPTPSACSLHLWVCFCPACLFVFQIPHIREIIWHLSSSVWIISLSTIPSRSIHVVADARFHSFLWLSHTSLCKCTTSSLSTRLPRDTEAASASWLSSVLIQWTHGCLCLFSVVFSVSSDK